MISQDKTLVVTEIYASIQGESSFAGYPCIFIRLTGCHLRCVYCDTPHAFSNGKFMTIDFIMQAIRRYPINLVEVTGGEPLLQKNVYPLMECLLENGYQVLLETCGDLSLMDVPPRVIKIVDIKCPDSGSFPRFYHPNLKWLMPWDQLKFVIRTDRDIAWALEFTRALELHRHWTVHFSPAHGEYPAQRLASILLAAGLPVHLQVQLHKYLNLSEGMDPTIFSYENVFLYPSTEEAQT